MPPFIQQNKLLVVVFTLCLLGGAYYVFFRDSNNAPFTATDSTGATEESQKLLVTLANLRTIHLDKTVFSNAVYLSLTDFGVTITPENIGRRNPFAPVGVGPAMKIGSSSVSSSTKTPSVLTLPPSHAAK